MSQTPSQTPNSDQIENLLDKIVFSLTEKRKKLQEETETLFNKVKTCIEEKVNKIKESGLRVTYWDCTKNGLLWIECVVTIEVDRMTFKAMKNKEIKGKFENYDAKLEIYLREAKQPEIEMKFEVGGMIDLTND